MEGRFALFVSNYTTMHRMCMIGPGSTKCTYVMEKINSKIGQCLRN